MLSKHLSNLFDDFQVRVNTVMHTGTAQVCTAFEPGERLRESLQVLKFFCQCITE